MLPRHNHPFRAIFRTDPFGWHKYQNEGLGCGYVGAIHKTIIEQRPHRICNEYISGELGRFLRLPVPPFGISHFHPDDNSTKDTLFSSLDFNHDRDSLPPVDARSCVERLPTLAAGILAFDILIANPDRRPENLGCDNSAFPNYLWVFDQDVALLGTENDGIDRLIAEEAKLGLRFSAGTNYFHCFLRLLRSARTLDGWINRIREIPDWFIDDICTAMCGKPVGLKKPIAKRIAKFLKFRKSNLELLITENRGEFTSIADWCEPGGLF